MSNAVPPGWYPDALIPGQVRYWDGSQWTAQARPAQAPADPYAPGAAGAAGYSAPPAGYAAPGYAAPPTVGYAAPPPVPAARKLSPGALIGILAGVVVVAVAVTLLIIFVPRGDGTTVAAPTATASTRPTASATAGPTASATVGPTDPAVAPDTSTPEGVALAYMNAVAAGDAVAARNWLDMGRYSIDNTDLLTQEVLDASLAFAPITDISVSLGTGGISDFFIPVNVDYRVGDQQIRTQFTVYQDTRRDDVYLVSDGLATFFLPDSLIDLDVEVNGQAVDVRNSSDFIAVFPGTYQFTTENEYATLPDTPVLIADPAGLVSLRGFEPSLTVAGLDRFRDLVRASLDDCLASKALVSGCELDVPTDPLAPNAIDGDPVDGTVTRTLDDDGQVAIAGIEAEPGRSPGQWRGDDFDYGTVEITVDCTKDGATSTCSTFIFLMVPYVSNLYGNGPSVTWDF